jgi:predicted transcriptional regulator
MVKVTFTLDEATVNRLQQAAERLHKPKSKVVREAVHEYHARIGKLSERERVAMLRTLDEWLPRIPARPAAEAAAELRELRRARRSGGRRTPTGR